MYNSVFKTHVNEITIRRSRFITTLIPIGDENEFASELSEIKKRYSDATHNCYACVINETATQLKFGDDGEPQGTAGMPMLEVLKKRGVYKTLAVVTRYFGGIKLGAGGLVGAYSDSVSIALDGADIRTYKYSTVARLITSYAADRTITEEICRFGKIIAKNYTDCVEIRFAVPEYSYEVIAAAINDITGGTCRVEPIINEYIDYKP